ncbi:hypothetical protein LCI18_004840 [Fusarium solani-melongenae]|uniref:Uncharacterized protein n=1 Tax=Fusarium solani subsp. cucurbitae TaxID=2747967 RepID=A0ACD3YY98_FUSSC|nr:hypothetical protein LCI18_004840 [Fusarium solani-melongenae]
MQNMMKEFFDSDFKPPERLPVNHAFLQALRGMVQSMNYIRDPEVWGRLVAINRNLRREFLILERAHFQNTGIRDHVVDAWDEFIRDELQLTLRYAQSFVTDWSNAGMNLYQPYSTNQLVAELVQTMLSLLGDSNDLDFDLDTLKGPRDPQNPDAPEDSEGLDGLEKLEDLSLE